MVKRQTVNKKDKKGWKPTGRDYTKRTEKPDKMEKGEVLEGKILAIQAGADSPVLAVLEDNTEKTRRVWMPTILRNSITTEDVGCYVAILCKGETKTKANRKLIDFEVFIAPREDDEITGDDETHEPTQ